MPEPSRPVPANAAQQQLAVWKHMEAVGFEQQDMDYVLAQFRVRKVNRILTTGSEYGDPFAWQMALDRARAEEKAEEVRLVSDHGYPDTSGLEWREAHQARLRFLMSKYPAADWDLLLRGQFEGRDRKPLPQTPRPVTLQVIEQTKTRFIALTRQREELKAYGDSPAAVQSLTGSLRRVSGSLAGYGIDPDALLEEQKEHWSLIPLEAPQKERLKQHVAELEELVAEMEALDASAESELLIATRRVLSVYREALAGFGDSLAALKVEGDGGVIPSSVALPATPPDGHPASDPATTPDHAKAVIEDEKAVELLTAQQAAKVLGVGYATMRAELNSGRFSFANRVGRNWRISRKALEAWLEGHGSDVESLKNQQPVPVPKKRGKNAPKPRYERPDGRFISF